MAFFTLNQAAELLGAPAPWLLSAIESKQMSAWKPVGCDEYQVCAANLAELYNVDVAEMLTQLEWQQNKIPQQKTSNVQSNDRGSQCTPADNGQVPNHVIAPNAHDSLLESENVLITANANGNGADNGDANKTIASEQQNEHPLASDESINDSNTNTLSETSLHSSELHTDAKGGKAHSHLLAEDPITVVKNNIDKYKEYVKFRTSQRKAFDDYAENNVKGIPDYVTAYNLKITTSNGRNLTLDTRKNSLPMLKKLFPSGRKSLGTKCENEAINIANKIIYEGLLEHGYSTIEKTKESDLWHHCFKDTYLKNKVAKNKTMSDMQSKLSFWFYVLSPISPEQIDRSMILLICDHLMDKHGMQGSTISGYFTELRKVLTYAHERGLIKSELNIPYLKSNQRGLIMVKQLTMALFIKIYARNKSEKVLLWLLWLTGLRVDMIISLTVEQIDFKERVITYAPDKNKSQKFISIPISKLTARLLQSQWKSIGAPVSGYIFPGLKIDYKRSKKAAEQAGLGKEFVPHHLRHNAVRVYLDAGISVEDIKVICGWTCSESMKRYMHNHIPKTAKDSLDEVRCNRPINKEENLDNHVSHITVTGNNNSVEINQSNALQKKE